MAASPPDDGSIIGRATPAKGVVLSPHMPLLLWCTVAAQDRMTKWAAQKDVMHALHEIWSGQEHAWLVGQYLLMPDHLHFFCCPRSISDAISIEKWTGYWKDRFAKAIHQPLWRWQAGLFHTRIRSDAHYEDRREYMKNNPVKAGLVTNPADWPWQGRVWDLEAHMRSFGDPDRAENR